MPAPLHWTETGDRTLRALRRDGASWDHIARALGVSRWTAIERAKVLGAHLPLPRAPRAAPDPLDDPDRAALPPGHPLAWAILTHGTLLQGTAYPAPPTLPEDDDDLHPAWDSAIWENAA
jgi:hypothetical protein